ncbi:hypothetical protein D3C71_1934460 [compost metagenome]
MGDTLDALTAGRYADTKIVSIETRQVIKSNNGVTISLSFSLVHNAPSIIVFMNEKVIPIPARPHKMPMGMLIKPMTIPSKNTEFRFCLFVAPTLASIPKWRERSETDIAKAL